MTPSQEADWRSVDRFLDGLLGAPDEALERIARTSEEAGLPDIAVSPLYGRLLSILVRSIGARRVLEVGTLGGYSTLWLARALPADGVVVTIEREPEHAEVARANLDAAGVGERVEIRTGDASATLEALAAGGEDPFDLIFLDADKEGLATYLAWSLRLSRPGTLILSDNVVRAGRVADPDDEEPRVRGIRRFLDAAAAEPRLETTVLQTVGVKGHDGLAISLVRS